VCIFWDAEEFRKRLFVFCGRLVKNIYKREEKLLSVQLSGIGASEAESQKSRSRGKDLPAWKKANEPKRADSIFPSLSFSRTSTESHFYLFPLSPKPLAKSKTFGQRNLFSPLHPRSRRDSSYHF